MTAILQAATESHLRPVDVRIHRTLSADADVDEIGRELAAGNPEAIAAWHRRLGPLVASYARRKFPGLDTDEVVQATMTEIWRVADRFDPSRSLEAWSLHIAARRGIDLIRRASRHASTSLESVGDVFEANGADHADRLAVAAQVRSGLDRLPHAQREVLELAYGNGMTQAQIAEHLDVPIGTIKARTFRGLKALRGILTEEGVDAGID